MSAAAIVLRNVYTVDQFSAEVLNGERLPAWVRKQCRIREIKTVAEKPYLIPQSEAVRFINPPVR